MDMCTVTWTMQLPHWRGNYPTTVPFLPSVVLSELRESEDADAFLVVPQLTTVLHSLPHGAEDPDPGRLGRRPISLATERMRTIMARVIVVRLEYARITGGDEMVATMTKTTMTTA